MLKVQCTLPLYLLGHLPCHEHHDLRPESPVMLLANEHTALKTRVECLLVAFMQTILSLLTNEEVGVTVITPIV